MYCIKTVIQVFIQSNLKSYFYSLSLNGWIYAKSKKFAFDQAGHIGKLMKSQLYFKILFLYVSI